MFSGIVEAVSRIISTEGQNEGRRFRIARPALFRDLAVDNSVAVNGVCLTVTQLDAESFCADVVPETLMKTTLGKLQPDCFVNLERALRYGDRVGGHLVQGHVEGVGEVLAIEGKGNSTRFTLAIPEHLMELIVSEGSITLDGVSLTVAERLDIRIVVAIIPYTLANTRFGSLVIGDTLNVETDLIAKHVRQLLQSNARVS